MKDGLYQVTTSYCCAGFTIKNGTLERCAPILWRKFDYFKTIAKWVGD